MFRSIEAKDTAVHFDPQERLGIFIDGAHLYSALPMQAVTLR